MIRGVDLLESTGPQIALSRLLSRAEPPTFFHHPLLMKSSAQKLSKSDGDTGVRELRAARWGAAAVVGHAARVAGVYPEDRAVIASVLRSLGWFDASVARD